MRLLNLFRSLFGLSNPLEIWISRSRFCRIFLNFKNFKLFNLNFKKFVKIRMYPTKKFNNLLKFDKKDSDYKKFKIFDQNSKLFFKISRFLLCIINDFIKSY